MLLRPWVEGAQCHPPLNILVATWLEGSFYTYCQNRKLWHFKEGLWLFGGQRQLHQSRLQLPLQLHPVMSVHCLTSGWTSKWWHIAALVLSTFYHFFPLHSFFFFWQKWWPLYALDGNSQGNDVALFLYYHKLQSKSLRAPGSISTLCSSKNSSPPIGRFYTHCHYMSLPLDNLERATKKFSSASARDIDMGKVTNGRMHRQQGGPSIKQFLVS